MRWIPFLLLLTACSDDQRQPLSDTAPALNSAVWVGQGRDRLCVAQKGENWLIGVITYGDGNNNCSMRAVVKSAEHGMLVQAAGDADCKFFIESDGETARFPARLPAACEYYCGPTASFASKQFRSTPISEPVTDLAGDPLC